MGKVKAVTCALIGHSRIVTTCFGYVYCARCGAQIGDTLAGSFPIMTHVILYHDCETCRNAAKSLTWKDRLFVPNPFNRAKVAEQQAELERARAYMAARATGGSPNE